MAVLALTNAFVHVAGHDFSGDSNSLKLTTEVEPKDRTTFGSGGWREFTGGLRSSAFDLAGFWQSDTAAAVDPQVFPNLGASHVHTVGVDNTEGAAAWSWQAARLRYQLLGEVGELAPFTVSSSGADGVGVVRGWLAKKKGAVSAVGALGSAVEVAGGVSASQHLYGAFHVFTAGTTITAVLESDDNAGFTTPTTRATVGPLTTTGGTWAARVAGPVTDTWFRWRVTAVTGTFTVAAFTGVQ